MILQEGGSITARQKQFIIKDQFQDTRSNTEARNKDRMCSQNNVSSSCCKAQQRLINFMNSKAKDVQPKILTDASIGKKSEFSEPTFVYKVQNLESFNASKAERKVREVGVIHNGRYEYYNKDHVSNYDTSIEITVENNSKKTTENCIKEKSRPLTISEALKMHKKDNEIIPASKADSNSKNVSKSSFFSLSKDNFLKFENQKISELHGTRNRDLNINKATIENNCKKPYENFIKEKLNKQLQASNGQEKLGNYKDFDYDFMESNQKIKTSISCENNSSHITDNNSNSNNTLKRLQHWLVKNDPEVSKAYTANKQATAKSRPLTISKALEMHERENKLIPASKPDSTSKNVSKSSLFSSSKDNLLKAVIAEPYEKFNRDLNIEKTIVNDCKKPNENLIKEKLNKQPQASNREEKLSNYKDFGNGFLESNRKVKTSFENSSSDIKDSNSTSENANSTDSTLKRLQHWFVKNEPEVSKTRSAIKQVTGKSRPLTISEALEMHERENEMNPLYKANSSSKNNLSNCSFFSSSKDNLGKVENLKITELHENFLVEKLENPMKSGRNLSLENKIDCDNQLPIKGFKPDDTISEFLSSDIISPRYTSIPKNRLSRACHDKNRNILDGNQRFSISTKNNRKSNIQKSCHRYSETQSDIYKKKRDGSTENNFTKSRNCAYICKESKSSLLLDCSYGDNNKDHSAEKTRNLKTALFSSSENLCSEKNYSVDTSKESFDSEEENVGIRNNKGFKQRSGSNFRSESSRLTRDKLSTRNSKVISSSSLSSESYNGNNDKKFSDPYLAKKDYSTIEKSPNSKTLPFKTDVDYSNRNSCDQSVPSDCFQKNRQSKAPIDNPSGSALTSVNPIHKEPAKISHALSSKDLFKKYNASNRQQTFKYAKSHSDFSEILKSSYLNPRGNDTTQNYSCLAQQRLLSCKSSKA